jgi:23S rRNA-/tRNA-specific pseudouridylate synthase
MLQRVRDAINDIDSAGDLSGDGHRSVRKVNLVHRLDRGASGALLLAFADEFEDDEKRSGKKGATATLIEAMASPESTKTYVALVRGEVSNR